MGVRCNSYIGYIDTKRKRRLLLRLRHTI